MFWLESLKQLLAGARRFLRQPLIVAKTRCASTPQILAITYFSQGRAKILKRGLFFTTFLFCYNKCFCIACFISSPKISNIVYTILKPKKT